jgi:hypothetical protein
VVAGGSSSQPVIDNSVSFNFANYTDQITITLTASDGTNPAKTATVIIPVYVPPPPQ